MYSARNIAQYIIEYESNMQRPVSNLRLQKLLYFVQAQSLVSLNSPCFDDDIEAWDFGPVVPNVYQQYKIFGSSIIPCDFTHSILEHISSTIKKAINSMLDICAQYTTSQLVEITHHQDPWINAYGKFDNRITPEAIAEYYKN